MTRDELNDLGAEILDSCIEVHRELGPGLLESVYVFALRKELELRGIFSEAEAKIPLSYKGYDTGKYYEIDLLVEKEIIIDVTDTGKGITSININHVFKPGFTTKKRGWGLGLSLSKRIIEQYHKGKLFVKSSEVGKGTTFRIELKK